LAIQQFTQVANTYAACAGIVPVNTDGTIYFYTAGELDSVYLRVTGYFI
jgi:hypothetical protein